MQTPSGGSSSLRGCLEAFVALVLVVFSLTFVIAAAQSSFAAGVVFAVLIIGTWIGVGQWRKRRREARALAVAHAQAAEHQRQLYAYHAEQERQRQAYEYEQQQQRFAREQEQERQRLEQEHERRQRWARLLDRYGQGIAEKIWAGKPWVGSTTDMLVETLGPPEAVDEKVLKTKVNHTYKYRSTGVNRYALRVYLSDGEVTGWEDKND